MRLRCLEAQELICHLQTFSCHSAGSDFSKLPSIFTNDATLAEAAVSGTARHGTARAAQVWSGWGALTLLSQGKQRRMCGSDTRRPRHVCLMSIIVIVSCGAGFPVVLVLPVFSAARLSRGGSHTWPPKCWRPSSAARRSLQRALAWPHLATQEASAVWSTHSRCRQTGCCLTAHTLTASQALTPATHCEHTDLTATHILGPAGHPGHPHLTCCSSLLTRGVLPHQHCRTARPGA